MKNLKKTIFSIGFTILLLEIVLRIFHINQTYSESIGQGYQTYFGKQANSWFLQWSPNDTFTLDHGDFKYKYVTNNLGLREKSTTVLDDTSLYKIIALGDSYTEGVGAAYDSSWPRFFERSVKERDKNTMVFDAGQSGSDPFYAYIFFKEKLAQFKPALVLSAVNTTDIDDFFFRGGLERFKSDGRVINRTGPWFEPLYKYSYVVRMIMVDFMQKIPQLFVTEKEYEKTGDAFVQQTIANYVAFKKAFKSDGKLLVVIHPSPDECAFKSNPKNIHTYAVMQRLVHGLQQQGIAAIDLYPDMTSIINEANVMEYTYTHDRHFNARGYQLFSEKLLEETKKEYPQYLPMVH